MGNIAFLLNCIANMGMSLFSLYSNVHYSLCTPMLDSE